MIRFVAGALGAAVVVCTAALFLSDSNGSPDGSVAAPASPGAGAFAGRRVAAPTHKAGTIERIQFAGGAASTGPGQAVRGVLTKEPAPLTAEELQRETAEHEVAPSTPVDPNAPLREGPPSIPPSAPPAGPEVPTAPTDLVLFKNTDIGAGTGSLINEPSTASNGQAILETWNWRAAVSLNGGGTFSHLNPSTLFPSVFGGFCCDQLALYVPRRDIYIWILQYSQDANNNNALRLAVANGQADLANASFFYWDLTPQQVSGVPSGVWYDQPKIATSSNYLYMEASKYTSTFQGSVVMRFSLDDLDANVSTLTYRVFATSLFSPGLTKGATGTMYFASHVNTSTLRLYRWPESVTETGVASNDITHTSYPANAPYSCPRTGAPATSDWCQRASSGGGYSHDPRVFAGWVSQGRIGFAWDGSQGTGGFGTFPYPYVHVVRIDESTRTLIDQPIIWNPNFAYSYISIAPNDRGDLGGTVMYGGGNTYQHCAVLVWDSYSNNFWELLVADTSDSDTASQNSGDYLTTNQDGGNGHLWNGACYALRGGGANANVHTYYTLFGRSQDAPPTAVTIHTAIATRTGRGVRVRWKARSRAWLLGFYVYRETGASRTRVNRLIIPSVRATREAYAVVDRRAGPGQQHYWIAVVHGDGRKNWFGPVTT
jgi:hypothetical protein